jgi:hypothetical protein
LNPPDPYLKGAWYPGGFNPCAYEVKNRFQNVPFAFDLRRYNEAEREAVVKARAEEARNVLANRRRSVMRGGGGL